MRGVSQSEPKAPDRNNWETVIPRRMTLVASRQS